MPSAELGDSYDVAVIGGRTIGANVARKFAEEGYDVALLERNATVGVPLACSGHFSRDLWDYVPDDCTELIQNEIRGARFHTGGRTYRYHKDHTVSWATDRTGLDQRMFRHAQDGGVDAVTGHALRDWEETGDGLRLAIDGPAGTVSLEAGIVAGCDGASSTVRRLAGLPQPRKLLVGMMGFTDEQDADDFVDVHLDVPGFFGWRIPRGEDVEYGVAVETHRDVKQQFEAFMEEHAPAVPDDRHAATIPMHPPETVTSDRAFLVGDAAGQTKPFTGGGIVYGLRCGIIAADTIDPADPATMQDYEQRWRDALGNDIRLGELVRKAYNLPSTVQRPLMKLFEGDISGIHMDKPTTLLSRGQEEQSGLP